MTCLPALVTWNPLDKSANVSLSNGNLTATDGSTGDMAVRATASHSSGDYYFEITPGSTYAGGDTGMGIARPTANLSSVGQNATLAALVFPSGAFYYNGSFSGQNLTGTLVSGTPIGFAVSMTNLKLWARNGAGNWNGSGTDNPATNTGGFNISALFSGQSFLPCQAFNSNGSFSTANFAGPFAHAAPSGFGVV